MDLRVLKQRIYNEAKIPTLLAALDCDHIHEEQGGELIVCQLPSKFHSDNRRSVQIKNGYILYWHNELLFSLHYLWCMCLGLLF